MPDETDATASGWWESVGMYPTASTATTFFWTPDTNCAPPRDAPLTDEDDDATD